MSKHATAHNTEAIRVKVLERAFERLTRLFPFVGPKHCALLAFFGWMIFAAETIILPIPAHADANSFLAYVHGHGINTGLAPDSKILHAGMFACESLHAGQTPDQVVSGVPFSWMDVRGIIDAAQHELCPDTLHG